MRPVNFVEGSMLVLPALEQLMHSECSRICRVAFDEGGLIRGGLLYHKAFENKFHRDLWAFYHLLKLKFRKYPATHTNRIHGISLHHFTI